jgi:hypothetical protein
VSHPAHCKSRTAPKFPKTSRSSQPRVVRLGHHPSVHQETALWSLSLRALESVKTRETPRCKHTKVCLMDISQTLKQTWPRERPRAAMCVQDVDVQCVLQFTLSNAASCALHRLASRVIHRSEVGFSFVFKGRELFRTLPATVTRKMEKFGAADKRLNRRRSIPRCGTAPFDGSSFLPGLLKASDRHRTRTSTNVTRAPQTSHPHRTGRRSQSEDNSLRRKRAARPFPVLPPVSRHRSAAVASAPPLIGKRQMTHLSFLCLACPKEFSVQQIC